MAHGVRHFNPWSLGSAVPGLWHHFGEHIQHSAAPLMEADKESERMVHEQDIPFKGMPQGPFSRQAPPNDLLS